MHNGNSKGRSNKRKERQEATQKQANQQEILTLPGREEEKENLPAMRPRNISCRTQRQSLLRQMPLHRIHRKIN